MSDTGTPTAHATTERDETAAQHDADTMHSVRRCDAVCVDLKILTHGR